MIEVKTYLNYRGLAILGLFLVALALPWSRAMVSIGTLIVGFSILFAGNPKHWLPELLKNKASALFSLGCFALAILSFFQANDADEAWVFLKLKLPFLAFPLCLAAMHGLKKWEWRMLLFLFSLSISVVAILTSTNYFLNIGEIHANILHSKPVPVIPNQSHIYFSVMLCMAIFSASYLFLSDEKKGRLRVLYGCMVSICFATLHILAARTGILAFYGAIFIWCFWSLLKNGNLRLVAGFFLICAVMPLLVWQMIPSVNRRVENTIADVNQSWQNGNPNFQSIGTRVVAWRVSWNLFKQKPLLGWGGAEMEKHMIRGYDEIGSQLLLKNMITPHNQFLENLAASGIFGGFILLGLLGVPLWRGFKTGNSFLILFCLAIIFSFLVESMLERQIGICFFLLFRESFPIKEVE